ncbi:valine--tRNA ligase, partial [Hamiltosporidium magnivora]
MGWPDNTKDYSYFYPTSVLETGSDILFFWVARMVMLGIELTNKIPFNKILLHGLIRDSHGKKMSKSVGNVIDPIDVIEGISIDKLVLRVSNSNMSDKEIKRGIEALRIDFPRGIGECGADALRFGLCCYCSGVKDVNLDVLRIEGYRKMCNKIWNAYKFMEMCVNDSNRLGSGLGCSGLDSNRLDSNRLGSGLDSNRLDSNRLDSNRLEGVSDKNKSNTTTTNTTNPNTTNTNNNNSSTTTTNNNNPNRTTTTTNPNTTITNPNRTNTTTNPNTNNITNTMYFIMNNSNILNSAIEYDLILQWIYEKRNICIEEYVKCITSYNFMGVCSSIHKYFIYDFCDVFIELCKVRKEREYVVVLVSVFYDILKMFSTVMPFISEEIYQKMVGRYEEVKGKYIRGGDKESDGGLDMVGGYSNISSKEGVINSSSKEGASNSSSKEGASNSSSKGGDSNISSKEIVGGVGNKEIVGGVMNNSSKE